MMNARNMIMMAAASVALFAACRKENLKEERKPLPKHDKLALEYVAKGSVCRCEICWEC